VVGLYFLLVYAVTRFTDKGRLLWARMLYAIPIAGTMIRSSRMAAFTELLAILVDHSLPLVEAFQLAGEASSDPLMCRDARAIHEDLNQGKPLGEVLRGRGLVPEWVSWMAGRGEQQGNLGQTLHQVAGMYRRQVEMRAALLRSVLPPFLIIGLAGVMFALFVFTGFLPMTGLLEALSR